VISPQLFWFRSCAATSTDLFVISIFVNIGMWFERFVIIVTSLHRDFLPVELGPTSRRRCRRAHVLGSFGLFFCTG
jgi:hypothetical protein